MAATAERLLDLAEKRFRTEGYNAVSFRQLADEIGVKSASVHYHFPTKEALGVAVVERYRDRVGESLGDPLSLPTPNERIERLITVFRSARIQEGMICLCGMLGAEAEGLPPTVRKSVNDFFAACLDWLAAALAQPGAPKHGVHARALAVLSMLEGAMVVSGTMADPEGFELVCKEAVTFATAPF